MIHSEKLLQQIYTLTVVTTPANATCTITYDGSTYTTKSVQVPYNTYCSIQVSYTNTTTKFLSMYVKENTTLTFTRTYTTSEAFVNNLTKTGTVTLNTSTGIASSSGTGNYLNFPSKFSTANNNQPVEITTKITTGSTITGTQHIVKHVLNSSTANYPNGWLLRLSASKLQFYVSNGSGVYLSTDSNMATNTTYYVKASWGVKGSGVMYLAYSTNNSTWIEKTGTKATLTYGTSMIGLACQNWLGTIDLMNTTIKCNGNIWWNGKTTSYTYYFTVTES